MPYRWDVAATTEMWQGDAIVIGSGPSGCAAATVLVRNGVKVSMVDDRRRTSWPGETLPAGSSRVISDVFGPEILDVHTRAFAVQAAWETEDLQVTDALAHPLGEGWLLDRRAFDAHAREVAIAAGVTVVDGHASVSNKETWDWRAQVGDCELHAPLVVDATGRSASVVRRAGARAREESRLLACIIISPDQGDSVQATTVESVPEGWWYSTPTPTGGRILALVSDADLVPRGSSRESWWLTSLDRTRHIRALTSSIPSESLSTMHVSQAGTGWLTDCHGPNWIAVGDAAAHFDPLSSQGLLTGILMGARAGQAFIDGALEDWSIDYRMLIDEHLRMASHYYGLVARWPDSQFWMRRIQRN